jgi:hypothetical protein
MHGGRPRPPRPICYVRLHSPSSLFLISLRIVLPGTLSRSAVRTRSCTVFPHARRVTTLVVPWFAGWDCRSVYVMAHERSLGRLCRWAPCSCTEPSSHDPFSIATRASFLPWGWCGIPVLRTRSGGIPKRCRPFSPRAPSGVLGRPHGGRPCSKHADSAAVAHGRPPVLSDAERDAGTGVLSPLFCPIGALSLDTHDDRPRPVPSGSAGLAREAVSRRNATWLILPVVICLSQRLSHACVSMN